MSFNLGQFRRDQLNVSAYRTVISSYSIQPNIITSATSSYVRFEDRMIKMTNGTTLSPAVVYYLKVAIHRNINRSQNLTVSLQNSSIAGSLQTLDSIYVPKGSAGDAYNVVYEMIIAPNGAYDEIVFTMDRTDPADLARNNGDGTYGAKVNIDVAEFCRVYNVIDAMGSNVDRLVKMGVQGRPGLLMAINGEQIRIGPSGIYEINNGYKVTSIGFILQNASNTADGKDYFILDYQY